MGHAISDYRYMDEKYSQGTKKKMEYSLLPFLRIINDIILTFIIRRRA